AEMVGRELLRRGYSVIVFAPYLESASRWWHHKLIRPDEDYVIRCYEEISPDGKEGKLDLDKVLEKTIDFLIVESYEKLPYKDVERLVKILKDKGIPSIAVVHEGAYEDIKYSDMNVFERVCVFDERYVKEVLKDKVKEEKIEIIPYPCYPVREGRRKFSQDGVIRFFSFGRQPKEEYCPYVEGLKVFKREFPNVKYRIVRGMEPLKVFEDFIEQEEKVLDYEEIIKELHSADFHLLPKGNTKRVVVSSTLYQVLGTLTITVVPDNRFFETLPRGEDAPVIFYRDVLELVEELKRASKEEEYRKRIKENARKFVEENSVEKITNRFEELINSILVKHVH
ncbi:MAG: glycosyltransferase family 1 protein, partial [Aquifex sp.]